MRLIWFWVLAGVLFLSMLIYRLVARAAMERRAKEREGATVSLREEQLEVRKVREQLADVTARREVTRDVKTVTVPVTKEDLVVEKNGVEAARIPLREDQVDVATRSVPLHEVSVYRHEWQENRQIEAVVKKEVAHVETTRTE